MKRPHRIATLLAGALLLSVGPVLTSTEAASAAVGGFSTVADLGYRATSVAATQDGSSAYTAGIKDGKAVVTLVAADGAASPVAVDAAGTRAQVAQLPQDPTGAYLLVTGGPTATLWTLAGTTATPLPFPATMPTSGRAFTPVTLAGNDVSRGLFLAGDTTNDGGGPQATALYYGTQNGESTPSWHDQPTVAGHGHVLPYAQATKGAFAAGSRGEGLDWQPQGTISRVVLQMRDNTLRSGYNDSTVGRFPSADEAWRVPADLVEARRTDYGLNPRGWGAQGGAGSKERGWCQTVGSEKCEAPAFPVSAAIALSDGRVLVGGRNTALDGVTPADTAAPAGFALTDTAQIHPAAVPGTVGNIVDDLSAATVGLKAWAVTFDGTSSHVQSSDLGQWQAPVKPTPPTGQVPAGMAFAPVTTVTFTAEEVVSPANGVAYVSGIQGGTAVVRRFAADGTSADVTFEGMPEGPKGTHTDIVATDGRVGLLVTGGEEATLWEIVGTTAYRAWLAASPEGSTNFFQPVALAADSPNSVWVTAGEWLPGKASPRPNAMHWDGTRWTGVGADPQMSVLATVAPSAYAADGDLFHLYYDTARYSFLNAARRNPNKAPVQLPNVAGSGTGGETRKPSWTIASADDYTMWGYTYTYSSPPSLGACTRVVKNEAVDPADTQTLACTPPPWAVSAATRLGDGRVVLGGETQPRGHAPEFALVQGQGSTPVAIPGTVGAETVSLAAAPTSGVVWAITKDAAGALTLQKADLGSFSDTGSGTAAPAPSAPALARTTQGFLASDR